LAKLEGKVAIVTGSGQGIGRGMAIALAKEGAKVVIAEINPETGKAVAEEIRKMGLQAINVQFDLGVEAQVRHMVDVAVKEFGPIDILINNGQKLFVQYDPIEEFPEERWDQTYQTGIKGTWYCCKAVFPYMKERGGAIINFGSGWGIYGAPGWSDYAGCKEAIRGFSKTAAKEWAKYKIRVNVICPGIESPSSRAFVAKFPEMARGLFLVMRKRTPGDWQSSLRATIPSC
jgi:2-hydroxycyclohexanecarboxyl-CoA dehydrogenase